MNYLLFISFSGELKAPVGCEIDWKTVIAGISALLTLIGLFWAVYQYQQSQAWKRLEFLSNEVKSFLQDETVKMVHEILDWEEKDITVKDGDIVINKFVVNEALLLSSLLPNDYGENAGGYNYHQQYVRKLFDAYFDKLRLFAHQIESGLIKLEDVKRYLGYYCKLLGNDKNPKKDWRNPLVIQQIWAYLEYYEYQDILKMLRKMGYPCQIVNKVR